MPPTITAHDLGVLSSLDPLTLSFTTTGEEHWGVAPDTHALLAIRARVVPDTPPDNSYLAWLTFGVGCFSHLGMVADDALHESYPLAVYVPSRQSFFIKVGHLRTPFQLTLWWRAAANRSPHSPPGTLWYDQPRRDECGRECRLLVPPIDVHSGRVRCTARCCTHAPLDYAPGFPAGK